MTQTKEKTMELRHGAKADARRDAELKEKTAEIFKNVKTRAQREAEAPTYRTVLVAASVGVLIGLLLRR